MKGYFKNKVGGEKEMYEKESQVCNGEKKRKGNFRLTKQK